MRDTWWFLSKVTKITKMTKLYQHCTIITETPYLHKCAYQKYNKYNPLTSMNPGITNVPPAPVSWNPNISPPRDAVAAIRMTFGLRRDVRQVLTSSETLLLFGRVDSSIVHFFMTFLWFMRFIHDSRASWRTTPLLVNRAMPNANSTRVKEGVSCQVSGYFPPILDVPRIISSSHVPEINQTSKIIK